MDGRETSTPKSGFMATTKSSSSPKETRLEKGAFLPLIGKKEGVSGLATFPFNRFDWSRCLFSMKMPTSDWLDQGNRRKRTSFQV